MKAKPVDKREEFIKRFPREVVVQKLKLLAKMDKSLPPHTVKEIEALK